MKSFLLPSHFDRMAANSWTHDITSGLAPAKCVCLCVFVGVCGYNFLSETTQRLQRGWNLVDNPPPPLPPVLLWLLKYDIMTSGRKHHGRHCGVVDTTKFKKKKKKIKNLVTNHENHPAVPLGKTESISPAWGTKDTSLLLTNCNKKKLNSFKRK